MAFWNRKSTTELPQSQVEYQETRDHRWSALLFYLITALVVAALVVFAARWVYRSVSNSSDNNPAPSTTQGVDKKKSTSKKSSSKATSSKPQSSSSSRSASGNSQTREGMGVSPTTSPSPEALPNNGPGEVIALFIGSTAIAAGLHYIISLRRSQNI